MLPIALTTPKLDALRSHKHSTQLYLSIYQPRVVMNGLVNNSSATRGDRTITYDNSASGTYAQIESGMTLWVGSASGSFDKGKVRVKSATINTLTVAENEYIMWQDNLFLTVVNYVDLVAVFPRLVQDTGDATIVNFYKDYDVAYTDQNSVLGAFPVMGSHRAGFLDDTGKIDLYWSATGTYPMVSGSNVRYDWTFGGASATGTTGQTPGMARYSGTGHYVTKLNVTVTGTGQVANEVSYRYVSIYDRPNRGTNVPIRSWKFSDLVGSRADGGFRGKVVVYETLGYKLQGGELAIIFSDDEFNGIPQSIDIGTVRPDDNIFFVGYILDDSIEYDYEKSSVSFDIGSASEVLKRTENFAISVESMSNPSKWWHFLNMTTKMAMYHYIKWHSTLMKVADIFWLGKDYKVQFFDSERTNIWDAIQAFMKPTLIGSAVTNNKGQVVFQTEPESFTTPTQAYSSIMTLDDRDVVGDVTVEENMYGEMSYLEMGGIGYDGTTSVPFLSAAPGIAPRYYGKNQGNQGLALLNQTNLNEITGNIYAKANADPQSFRASMAGNYRYTIAPLNQALVYVPANRTSRNKMVSGTFYVDNVNYNFDAQDGYLSSTVDFVPVVNGIPGVTLEIKPPNTLAPLTFPPLVFPGVGGFGTSVKFVAILTTTKGIWYTTNFDTIYPLWLNCGIAFSSYVNQTVTETDTNSEIFNMEVSSDGYVVACGKVAVYAGEIGALYPIIDQATLVNDMGDFELNPWHPRFYGAGISNGGFVCAIAGHPYSSRLFGTKQTRLYAGGMGGLTAGDNIGATDEAFLADIVGSITNKGGGWFITYGGYPVGGNNVVYSPNGLTLGMRKRALGTRTRQAGGFYHNASPGGIRFLHGTQFPDVANQVFVSCDVYDVESSIADSVDTTTLLNANPGKLAVSSGGVFLRVGTTLRKSANGGSTWSSITGSGAWSGELADSGVCNAGDDSSWILAKNKNANLCGVYWTPDNGATWYDKTGNLRNYFTNDFQIKAIKAIL